MRSTYRPALLILTLSFSGVGAQSLFYANLGKASESASLHREALDIRMDHMARKMLKQIAHSVMDYEEDENIFANASPEATKLQEIPGHKSYRYAVIGSQRVIVDSATHSVIYRLN